MICQKCGSNDVNVQTVVEFNKLGCLHAIGLFILLLVPVISWIVIFYFLYLLLGRGSKTITYATCQNCGHREEVKQ